jgi:citrate lyase beta subunit
MEPRSLLFAPGDRPDRFAKALACGADAVCLDLEDAVAPAAKAAARAHVLAFLQSSDALGRVLVRINALGSPEGALDIAALAGKLGDAALMISKASDPSVLASVGGRLWPDAPDRARIVALIEDAQGLRRAHDLARVPGVIGLALGPVDLAASLGAVFDEPILNAIRLQLRLAAAEGGVGAWDGPWLDVQDVAGLDCSAAAAARLGFSGKLCIHPSQVQAVHRAFTPAPDSVARARAILDAAGQNPGAFLMDGKMVDAPVIEAARRLMARAAD